MPLIYTYKCPNPDCGFTVKGNDSGAMFVKMADGREEILAHPLEESDAKQKTGKTIKQLSAEKRISFRPLKHCARCRRDEFDCKCPDPKWFSLKGLEGKPCPVCGQGKMTRKMTGIS